MATFLKRASKYKPLIYYQGSRNYFTGSRYSGYVNYFHNENLFGFVVREDAPEREYYFHVTDLHAENIPRVRPLQSVEFSIIEGRGGNFMARDISSLGGQPIRYSHANMKMKDDERTRNLSELPNSELERHTGVVVSIMPSGKGGLIIPDRLNFAPVGYSTQEIQSTGAQRLERFSEVEFYVRSSKYNNRDRGVCITRRGNGLITAERRNTGHSRRMLGAMYGSNDIQAQIPKDFQSNRQRGYIVNYSREKLYGFIQPFEVNENTPATSYFVHIDDCHIYGTRFLKRFEEVEYSVVTDQSTGKSKALHVSAPNKTVLRSVSDNRYLPVNLTNTKLSIDESMRYKGSVMIASPTVNWFIIKPDDKGYEAVIGFKNNIHALGNKRILLDDRLEFNVSAPSETYSEKGGLLRATQMTAISGKPILCEGGELGKYLQTKMNLPFHQNELEEYDMDSYNKGTILNGFVASYNSKYKVGQVEIESPDFNKRYRRCYFKLDDAILNENSDDLDLDRVYVRDGHQIQFELDRIDYSKEFEVRSRRKVYDNASDQTEGEGGSESEENFHFEEIEPLVHIKAINVVSKGLDFIEIQESNTTMEQRSTVPRITIDNDEDEVDNMSREKRQRSEEDQFKFGQDEEDEDDEPLFGNKELK